MCVGYEKGSRGRIFCMGVSCSCFVKLASKIAQGAVGMKDNKGLSYVAHSPYFRVFEQCWRSYVNAVRAWCKDLRQRLAFLHHSELTKRCPSA